MLSKLSHKLTMPIIEKSSIYNGFTSISRRKYAVFFLTKWDVAGGGF